MPILIFFHLRKVEVADLEANFGLEVRLTFFNDEAALLSYFVFTFAEKWKYVIEIISLPAKPKLSSTKIVCNTVKE